jgi:hypothetical protein
MPDPGAPLPARPPNALDRAAVERVLTRAAELQAASGEASEPEGQLSEAQLLDLGREVGLSAEHLRQALAEERTRVPEPAAEHGILSGILGPAQLWAQRTVPGRAADILAALDGWMQREECLQVKRQFPERVTWEARRDLVGTARRALSFGRDYVLARAVEVSATAVPVDERRALVRLEADLRPARARSAAGGAGILGVGAAGAGALAIMGFAAPVLVLPVIAGAIGGYASSRTVHRRTVARAQLALEQVLDRLERGDLTRQPNLLRTIADIAGSLPRRPGP